MHELHSILAHRDAAGGDLPGAILVTVVHVKGSSYRRPGARMLILPDGSRIGSVSGGCLEGDLLRKAWWLTADGRPTVRIYDTTSEDDAIWEFGLGCNGIIHVLLERADTAPVNEILDFLNRVRVERTEAAVVTLIRTDDPRRHSVGDRLLVDPGGVRGGDLQRSPEAAVLRAEAGAALQRRKSHLARLADSDYSVEYVGPPVSLVVFGAGHDAIPLVSFATRLGWDVSVADGRPAYARSDRFPDARRVMLIPAGDPLAGVPVDNESIVVMMTHNFEQDQRLIEGLVRRRPRYLGMLGPKVRAEKLLAKMVEAGEIDSALRESMHGPVGLDLGADTPETIALSIIAEIQAFLGGREGGKLKHRVKQIHLPVDEVNRSARIAA